MIDGPDFICIGQPKAGTGWLYDQLFAHPQFWMPPAKELTYLNQPAPTMRFTVRIRRKRRKERWSRDERDARFLDYARKHRGEPMNLETYAGLFAFKQERMSGDVSPMYCLLPAEVVAKVAARFPKTKIVHIVRDPVARAWSRISMAWRDDKFDKALLSDADAFRGFLERSERIGGIFATQTVERWQRWAPELAFRNFLFDDLVRDPATARRDVLLFLGADPGNGDVGQAEANRKAGEPKPEMTDQARDVLVAHFAEELRKGAGLFGGAARHWAEKYGVL
jgi:hypothetical protein